jgi:hypothetical protein
MGKSGGKQSMDHKGDHSSKRTTDPEEIRRWVESRKGKPTVVKGTEDNGQSGGLLRIDFPGGAGEDRLQEIPWEEFFHIFEEAGLEFLYQEETADGKRSTFNKFVRREAE